MNVDYCKILRSLYALDTALATYSNAPEFTKFKGKMSSHYAISIEREIGKSSEQMDSLLKVRDNAIQFCIKNGLLNFYRQQNGYDAFEGEEQGDLFLFLSGTSYRKESSKSTLKRDSMNVFNDYSKNTLSLAESIKTLRNIPETNLLENTTGKMKHSKEAMANFLGVVNGFDFSNCYDENGLVEIDFHDFKSEPFDVKKANKGARAGQFGRR